MKSLSEMRSLFKEPQLLHKWTVEIPHWPTAVPEPSNAVLFMVTSSSVPEAEHENVSIELGGFKMNYNGKETRNGSIDWTFFENTASDVLQYFFIDYANARQNHKSNSSISLVSSDNSALIAPLVNLNLLAADGNTVTKQIQLVNVLFEPSSFGGELGQAAEAQKPTVKVLYDSFVLLKISA